VTLERGAYLGSCSCLGRSAIRPATGTQQREREDEEDHKQEYMQVHEVSSWLEMRSRDRFLLKR